MYPETWPLPRIHWLPPCIIGPQASSTIGVSLAAASVASCSTESNGAPNRLAFSAARMMSSLRQTTPFGLPVVPPV